MEKEYKILGNYIRLVDERNKNLAVTKLLGVSISKKFIPSIANIVGTDLSNYKIVRTGQFAYGPVTSRNGEKISIAYLDEEDCIISSSYTVFEVENKEELDPEYLMLWFSRPEFDRYARYKSHGSVREIFDWNELCMVELPVPDIEKQRKIVKAYKTITDRIDLKQKINDNLEAQAINLYKAELKVCATDEIITGTISDIGEFVRGKNITAAEMVEGNIPVISAGLQPSGHHHKSNVSGPSITVSGSGVNAGYVSFHLHDIWAADCSYNNSSCYVHCLYVMMKDIQAQITELQKGTAQPHVYPKELNPLEITYPNSDILNKLEHSLSKIFAVIEDNDNEISKLKQMQTVLLATLSSR